MCDFHLRDIFSPQHYQSQSVSQTVSNSYLKPEAMPCDTVFYLVTCHRMIEMFNQIQPLKDAEHHLSAF